MKYGPKLNRHERRLDQKKRKEEALRGEGIYVYENNTAGSLNLPKPPLGSKKMTIEKGEQFQGDNYFMRYVPTMLRYIREIQSPQQQKENAELIKESTMSPEQKLILDQPDRVTPRGTVEQVIPNTNQEKLNENQPNKPEKEVLLTEDPLDGVEILLN